MHRTQRPSILNYLALPYQLYSLTIVHFIVYFRNHVSNSENFYFTSFYLELLYFYFYRFITYTH